MTFSGDPYRILGLAPGASLDDVKRAYRRLAKRYHPDAGGPDALARFLLIHGAYETIAGPSSRAGRGPSARRTSAADPDRARATRAAYRSRAGGTWASPTGEGGGRGPDTGPDRAHGGRAGAGRPDRGGPGTGPAAPRGAAGARGDAGRADGASDGRRADGRRADGRRADGAAGSAASGEARRTASPPRRPSRRKATLSSTSYDDAAQEPRHPDWQGSSWYGTSSGTYWTINPREYADPRKHGPEYQARARRAAGPQVEVEGAPGSASPADASGIGGHEASGPTWSDAGSAGRGAAGRPVTGPQAFRTRDEPAASRIPTAGSIGLASGAVAAIPAAVLVLGSTMAGDLSLAALALAVPAVVALGVGLGVGLLHRGGR